MPLFTTTATSKHLYIPHPIAPPALHIPVSRQVIRAWLRVLYDDQLSELQAGGGDRAAEGGKVVLVAASELLDDAMGAKPFEHSRQLRWRDSRKAWTEGVRLESPDSELAAGHGPEETQIGAVQQVEATIVK